MANTLERLPEELLLEILWNVEDVADVRSLAGTSRVLRRVVKDERHWKRAFEREYPALKPDPHKSYFENFVLETQHPTLTTLGRIMQFCKLYVLTDLYKSDRNLPEDRDQAVLILSSQLLGGILDHGEVYLDVPNVRIKDPKSFLMSRKAVIKNPDRFPHFQRFLDEGSPVPDSWLEDLFPSANFLTYTYIRVPVAKSVSNDRFARRSGLNTTSSLLITYHKTTPKHALAIAHERHPMVELTEPT